MSKTRLAAGPAKLEKLIRARDFVAAEAAARQQVQRSPRDAFARKALAASLVGLGRHADAVPILRAALVATPGDPELHANLGMSLFETGEPTAAMASLELARRLAPRVAIHHVNAAGAYLRLGDLGRAVAAAEAALSVDPRHLEGHRLLGVALGELKDYDRALTHLVAAVENADEDNFPALQSLASLLMETGRHSHALGIIEQVLAELPDDFVALARAIVCQLHVCAWAGLDERVGRLAAAIDAAADGDCPVGLPPFSALPIPGLGPARHRRLAAVYARDKVAACRPLERTPAPEPASGRRLRIGYLSSDLRDHAVGYLLAGVLHRHDRTRFELFGYYGGPEDASDFGAQLRRAFDGFREIRLLSNEEAARRIADDRIDLLVDLQGWTQMTRLPVLACRPAPLQVGWLGFPGTVGLASLADYLIGDPVVTPAADAGLYAERLALLPHCYLPFDDRRAVVEPPSRAAAGLPAEGFVFCSFNLHYKINPACFDLWCRILAEVPDSVLWLARPGEEQTIANLRQEAGRRGIDADRLVFAPRTRDVAEHLARIGLAGLVLDTFPYNVHSTGLDALWAGVPILTLPGESFASRVAASQMRTLALDEFIAADGETYVRTAVTYARDPERQAAVRARLAAARRSNPLFDTAGFTRSLEALYESLWQRHADGQSDLATG